jgi:nucleotide-binding universal stress UspA family protein
MAMKTVDQVSRSPVLAGLGCKLVMAGDDTPENRRKLDDAAAILKGAGFIPEVALVQGQADKVITAIIEQEGYDLLAMGAYSHSRLRSLFIGSTTTEMVRSCKVPVVIFR